MLLVVGSTSFEWLLRLRWLAIGGQALTLFIAWRLIHLPLQLPLLVSVFGFTAFTNVALAYLPESLRQRPQTLQAVLVADVLLLTLLLAFSGGPENPFSILYLLHVVLAAVLLDRRWALIISTLSIVLFAALFRCSMPTHSLHRLHETAPGVLNVHLLGMWIAYSLVALISAYCVTRISEALRKKEREAERLSLRQKQLASLTTLAAGAAHELATPLGTIAIAIGELERSLRAVPGTAACIADVELVSSQIMRCKDIISRMSGSSRDLTEAADTRPMPVDCFLEHLFSSLQERFGKSVSFETVSEPAGAIAQGAALVQASVSLVKNAVEASCDETPHAGAVHVRVEGGEDCCRVRIRDGGSGMEQEILSRIGEPFFTTKPEGKGMGLGVFLARLTAEGVGGALRFVSSPGKGTEAELTFPLCRNVESGCAQ